MSKVVELTDEQYQVIERAAQSRGETLDTILTKNTHGGYRGVARPTCGTTRMAMK